MHIPSVFRKTFRSWALLRAKERIYDKCLYSYLNGMHFKIIELSFATQKSWQASYDSKQKVKVLDGDLVFLRWTWRTAFIADFTCGVDLYKLDPHTHFNSRD